MDLTCLRYRPRQGPLRRTLSPSGGPRPAGSAANGATPMGDTKGKLQFWMLCMPVRLPITYRFCCCVRSLGSSRYAVRSVMVSDAVVPLMVSIRCTSPVHSSRGCHMPCVRSRGRLRRSIVHLPYVLYFPHTISSSSWSSSNRCRSNCSNHRAR